MRIDPSAPQQQPHQIIGPKIFSIDPSLSEDEIISHLKSEADEEGKYMISKKESLDMRVFSKLFDGKISIYTTLLIIWIRKLKLCEFHR